jgi:Domain of unknown function (DUF1937)
MIYLASPYSHPEREIRIKRFEDVARVAAKLMNEGHIVISPICHSHPIAELCDMPKEWEFWERIDKEILSKCEWIFVLCLNGWKDSRGIKAEINYAQELNMPIAYIDEELNSLDLSL